MRFALRMMSLLSLGAIVFVGSTVARFSDGRDAGMRAKPQGPEFFSPSLFSVPTALAEYTAEGGNNDGGGGGGDGGCGEGGGGSQGECGGGGSEGGGGCQGS